MTNAIEGTIIIPADYQGDRFGKAAFDPGIDLQVDWNGQIEYAVIGERGSRTWWFAGFGSVKEDN